MPEIESSDSDEDMYNYNNDFEPFIELDNKIQTNKILKLWIFNKFKLTEKNF